MITRSLELARLVVGGCLLLGVGFATARELEKSPVKYVWPFEIVEKEGGYNRGDDVLVRVHFCIAHDVEAVHYKSITQMLAPVDEQGDPIFIEPILDLDVVKATLGEHGMFYTDMDGYECFKALGAAKPIPTYTPPGCYVMNFVAIVEGKRKDHQLEYSTVPFCIS